MAFDGLFTRAITHEIENSLYRKNFQNISTFKIRDFITYSSEWKEPKLILSSHPTYARMHLTNQNYDSPAIPPMFCMLLRKHLEGGFIEKLNKST